MFPVLWLGLKGVWKLKNRHLLTFGIVKSVWSIVWCSRLFLRIAMTLLLAPSHRAVKKWNGKWVCRSSGTHFWPNKPYIERKPISWFFWKKYFFGRNFYACRNFYARSWISHFAKNRFFLKMRFFTFWAKKSFFLLKNA